LRNERPPKGGFLATDPQHAVNDFGFLVALLEKMENMDEMNTIRTKVSHTKGTLWILVAQHTIHIWSKPLPRESHRESVCASSSYCSGLSLEQQLLGFTIFT
jgi:hypothetical protein